MLAETSDIYEAAYLLTTGATLAGTRHEGHNGGRRTLFELRGDLGAAQEAFYRGEATANVHQLRRSLNMLKDMVFSVARDERRRSHDRHFACGSRAR